MTESEAIVKFKRTSVLWESASNTEIVEAVKVAISALEEVQQYRAIGTVSEFQELKEKATAKKPLHQGFVYACPCCNDKVSIGSTILRPNQNFCIDCGTEFDWSEGKE